SGGSKEAPSMEWLRMREARVLDMLEKRLSQSDYFAGPELTAADIMIAYTLVTSAYFAERDLSAQPAIRAYVARIKARPAFQRAKAKADPV
ncbi:MAG: glutathione S-transferase family protein, partial [Hyphomonadaceae bacterium]